MELLEYVDFLPLAEKNGFILVYPQGSLLDGSSHWNVGGWTAGSTADDVGFTQAIMDALSTEYNIDQNRVYAMGHSNGGFMSLRLACDLSDKIAAVVSVSGSMTPEMLANCDPKKPISVMEIHGTADNSVPYDGSDSTLSIDEMLKYWVTNNGCDPTPIINDLPHNPNTTNDTSVEQLQYGGCENGVTVEHYKYIGGGHEWLGTLDQSGQFNADLDTAEAIWAFLPRNSLTDIKQ
jgi:polyhydroxybutyrate depolymerase